ncbi:Tat (twin-arginine translocation) pathway signal sequence containing protein [Sabulilitoribacter arenilitoris]|uniref:Tat (Twin-arginine translocation) pathway signal sequence containing protein n=1 Tax=Wocania arenilitoris TaxID=2044858 RepID=A0AAE3EPG1_9FLAO|nr:Tat (twin-arginine translocation) pathway signal sequence containing protein [Wocania arenilitoris]MCF7568142.1 Tat (twin-arginine translocation) pathway signal sequence containing protein [Wocania arenilitoris]
MKTNDSNSRRQFLGAIALGATASTISVLTNPIYASTKTFDTKGMKATENWFDKIKGTHRIVYDGSTPHAGLPILWNWAFYLSHNSTDSPDSDITAMTVLRHSAIPLALNDDMWAKYKLGEFFGVKDHTKDFALRNPWYEPQDGDYPINGPGGIKEMQSRGGLFCVCNLALQVYSGKYAEKNGGNPEEIYKDWIGGLISDIELVPSGVWALGKAQAKGCGYIFAGE